jgi:transcriptional repressor NrdR
MRCPYCRTDDDRVVDSRAAEGGATIRRRRECRSCGQRFSTYERAETVALVIRKRSGDTESFQREKVQSGIEKAVKNLAVDEHAVRRTVARVEARVRTLGQREVSSSVVGAEVLDALRELDPVAYVRFASVYKGFTSPEDFARELATLEKDEPATAAPGVPVGGGPRQRGGSHAGTAPASSPDGNAQH